jgi:hypothetical protein
MFFNCALFAFFEEIPCFCTFSRNYNDFSYVFSSYFRKKKYFCEKASTKIIESPLASKPICALIPHLSPILVLFRPIILLHITT